MCDFCTKHGQGKRWYLEAKNYSDDLLHDVHRQKVVRDIAAALLSPEAADKLKSKFQQLDKMDSLPRPVRALVSWLVTWKMKRLHFGQVVPIEDVEKIFGIVNSIVRLPCVCRNTLRREQHHFCLGISSAPDFGLLGKTVRESYDAGPDLLPFEQLTPAQALALMREWELDGLAHTVWTFDTPFIGGICNCDRTDCMAMIATVGRGVKLMFRAEFVAQVDWDRCTGCRSCMRVCQFGALGYSAAQQKASVDLRRCYGCGLCRSVCPEQAIRLDARADVPEAAGLW